ncbi:hypothetical protein ACOI1H_19785 [Loktanella sp. DJP18]|uniref:hypothetical protein n=1 Tax=Loktanella sp. DJP18 TaxID=3409788 RepID=UPI003BB6C0DC
MASTTPPSADFVTHMEAICAYLGSRVSCNPGREALISEAKAIIDDRIPCEDMAYAISFLSESAELVTYLCDKWGDLALSNLDPFGCNTRSAWRSMNLPDDLRSRVFQLAFNHHREDYLRDPSDSLIYAIETHSAGIIDSVMAEATPSDDHIAHALLVRTGMNHFDTACLDQFISLARRIKSAPLWQSYLTRCTKQGKMQEAAMLIRIGVDITPYAQELIALSQRGFRALFTKASSHHGRMELMATLPGPRGIMLAPPRFVEDLLFSLEPDCNATSHDTERETC